MYEELKERLRQLESDYDGKIFWGIIDRVKRDRLNDDELLRLIEGISQKRFREKISFTLPVPVGNMLEAIAAIAAVVLASQMGSDWILYISAPVLMTTLHPLFHYTAGTLLGIRFTHYYLNGPALVEPTLKIDYFSYLKASPGRRAIMHASGVVGTVIAPLVSAAIALDKDASDAAFYLFALFLLLVVFELLTSTKIGDLMRARREYRYR